VDIEYRKNGKKWIAEVWTLNPGGPFGVGQREPYTESVYVEINKWCLEVFGYHARTAYHVFELKNKKHLDWFLLKWL
jgi:hypothetical protein